MNRHFPLETEKIAYYEHQHAYMDAVDSNYVRMLVDELILAAQLKPSDRILEIGCGTGRFSLALLKKGYSLTCVDQSEHLLSKFKTHFTSSMAVKVLSCNLGDLSSEYHKAFDKVIGFYILHHLNSLTDDMARLHRLMKNGGRVVFVEPNPFNIMFYLQLLVEKDMRWEFEKGILKMTKSYLTKTLLEVGYSEITVKPFGFLPPFAINTKIGLAIE